MLLHFRLQNNEYDIPSANSSNIIECRKIFENSVEKNLNDINSQTKLFETDNEVNKRQDHKQRITEKKMSARDKSLAKAASGAKNIKSFFTAK